jgi:AcrR family transcriptional regulator
LLDAALEACVRHGLTELSVQHVADAAQVTKSLVLYHFHDRAGLLDALADRAAVPLDAAYATLADPSGDPREHLNRWLSVLFEGATDPRRPYLMHVALTSGRALDAWGTPDRLDAVDARRSLLLENLLTRGHVQYAWHAPDPMRTATLLRSLTEGMLLQAARTPEPGQVARLHAQCRAAVLDLLMRR